MTIDHYGHIGVLNGGQSAEREISLKSGKAIFDALKSKGCTVSSLDITTSKSDKIYGQIKKSNIDVAFIALHGPGGEDGSIQSICERAEIPYTGSGVEASKLVINKVKTQEMLQKNNVSVPAFRTISKNDAIDDASLFHSFQGSPLVIKPAYQGSSIGITVVNHLEDLNEALATAFEYGDEVLIEQYISGRELTVSILDQKPLSIIEVKPKNNFFDFTAKYQKGMTEYIIPAEIPEDKASLIQQGAKQVHDLLGCRHYSRVDLMIDRHMRPFFLEVNTIPGFTETSLLPMAAKQEGLEFSQLCLNLIQLAYETKN